MNKLQPSMSQVLNAKHISYANELGEDEGGFCTECLAKIPDASIGKVNKSTYYILTHDGKIVLLNPSRINKRNVDAISTRLQAFGAGYCIDCRAPHPLSNMGYGSDGNLNEVLEATA
jgi:hypothetical protein